MRRVLRKRINLLRLLLIGMPVALFSNECDARSLSVNINILTRDSLRNDTLKGGELQEVTVTATRFLFVTKKDTTIYDLDALHLKSGAPLREAFEKLPGMSFRDGKLYHNGREVKRVLINGMDFSYKDPMLALQALPSYIMKDVKVYERKSDFSMRYGMDDGREELVADVSVRRRYMGTWSGELAVGGGMDERFMGRGYGNTFTDRFRVSLFGNANNINEQMWYGGDGKERAGEVQAITVSIHPVEHSFGKIKKVWPTKVTSCWKVVRTTTGKCMTKRRAGTPSCSCPTEICFRLRTIGRKPKRTVLPDT